MPSRCVTGTTRLRGRAGFRRCRRDRYRERIDHSELLGRAAERERLRALLSSARNGSGGAVLLHGEPGVGKTSVVSAALDDLEGFLVLRADGVEVETAVAYGALQRLLRPLARDVDEIPEGQRAALGVALGLEEGEPPQLALVGLAVLSALARAGDARPVVCVVDDAHDVDAESLLALGFVARRLAADAVCIVLASRPHEVVDRMLAGVPRIELGGLDDESAAALLQRSVEGRLDATVVDGCVSATGGNPLALREMAAGRKAEQLTATVLGHAPLPIGRRLEQVYTARIRSLPSGTRTWLLIAALESTGSTAVVDETAQAMGVTDDAPAAAEEAGLVTVRDAISFRHPLIRSAVSLQATDSERRRVHRLLGEVATARGRDGIAAWHAAAAAARQDESIAAALAVAADDAGARGGMLSRAQLLTRAGELSPDAAARHEHFVAAAEAAISAGAATLALQMLDRVEVASLDDVGRGRRLIVEAMCGMFLADSDALRAGMARLIEAASLLRGTAPHLARYALLLAVNAATVTEERATGATPADVAVAIRSLPPAQADASGRGDPAAVVLDAVASFVLDPYEDAVPRLRAAVAALDTLHDDEVVRFAFAVTVPSLALWDWEAAARLLKRVVSVGRRRGALREVDGALWILSAVEISRSDPASAAAYIAQSIELRRALGSADDQAVNAALLAWQGTPAVVVDQIAHTLREAGWGGVARMAVAAVAVQDIAEGAAEPAFERLRGLLRQPFLQASFHHYAELVEAAVRSGNRGAGEEAARALGRYASASGSAVAAGLHERARALLADDVAVAERHFLASLAALDRPGHLGDRSRTRLLYGEWLRRQRRRAEAAVQLHEALRGLTTVGAERFAARARRELEAGGVRVVAPADAASPELTAQESEVARLAARGATNGEIGAALFISANTVDYHLRKVFRKLGISSRRQLADRMNR
ncbi:LuxR family transcriptional regulator [Herbiconiux moechotypicola]|uniref:helix-turn-helix transcriptional regulator n=1 Tax=Herbiconiux moechotypicola TaxID=637393 RepID=UPI00217D5663|nr:LuxR family transcriptional regulator [Herbiconiux moechotypicola]MCS5731330.1 LuxR family transcriptional regulator [Herbiconiux moechotypicola]